MQDILVTGANRGVGLALVQALTQRAPDSRIFAACRQPSSADALAELARGSQGKVEILALDVGNVGSIRSAAATVATHTDKLDLLINNAGIMPSREQDSLASITFDTVLDVLRVNSAGPLIMVQSFWALLSAAQGPRVANISSSMGSIAGRQASGNYAYCTSKAALNMISRILAFDMQGIGGVAVALDPGWVQTDMGGSNAALTPLQSASAIIDVLFALKPEDNGRFLSVRNESGRLDW